MQLLKRVLLPFLWGKRTFSVPSYKDSHCPNEIVDVEVFVYFDDAH